MSEDIRVTVKMLSMGLRSLECVVRKDITVGDFKKLIEETDSQNVAADRQRLTYDNKELTDDTVKLGDLTPPIEEWSVFTLVLKLDRSQIVRSAPEVSEPSPPPPAVSISNEDHHEIEMNVALSNLEVDSPTFRSDISPTQPSTAVWFQVQYGGDRHIIRCNLTDTVLVLKSLVWESTGVLPDSQRLVCNGSVFEDSALIQSYNLGQRGTSESEPVNVTLVRSIAGTMSRENDPDMTADFGEGPEIMIDATYKDEICVFSIPMNAEIEALRLRMSDKFFEEYARNLPASDQNLLTFSHPTLGIDGSVQLRDCDMVNMRINEVAPLLNEGDVLKIIIHRSSDEGTKLECGRSSVVLFLFAATGLFLISYAAINGFEESPPQYSRASCFDTQKPDNTNFGYLIDAPVSLCTSSGWFVPKEYVVDLTLLNCYVNEARRCTSHQPTSLPGDPKIDSILMTVFGACLLVVALSLSCAYCGDWSETTD
eukprot:TRINITY_DN4882_c0_g2_i2.p1 TRINITY_DN4882_c0_g2~~TRINITY_DN4882_c0_g2_i2.p1  ORF type:complete len:482 (+),score=61.20 TRINITY_DN4882_c0_g2_i2:43-1488(+)